MMNRGENANFWSRKELINIVREGKFWGVKLNVICRGQNEYIGARMRYSVVDKENVGGKI